MFRVHQKQTLTLKLRFVIHTRTEWAPKQRMSFFTRIKYMLMLEVLQSNMQLRDSCCCCVLQAQQILLELQSALLRDDGLKDLQKAKVCQVLAEADKSLVDGSDEFLQLVHVTSYTQRVLCGGAT